MTEWVQSQLSRQCPHPTCTFTAPLGLGGPCFTPGKLEDQQDSVQGLSPRRQ